MRRFLAAVGFAAGLACADGSASQGRVRFADTTFGGLVRTLSEPGGYFDTDNLISNERSYLHVMGALDRHRIRGGAYLGVGPDQNFSYIAAIEPEIAFMIDIRRDNLLEHLLFKALFAETANRTEYLAMLLGVPMPPPVAGTAIDLVRAFDTLRPNAASADRAALRVTDRVRTFGVELSDEDIATIQRFHRAFMGDGLELRFHSFGRAPQPYYPTYRDLLVATDRDGTVAGFMATEDRFQTVRRLHGANRIVPVVGNLAGDHALRAIGAYLHQRGIEVTALYTSNVEFYLFGDGTFPRFVRNLRALPAAPSAVIIRSVFTRGGRHPQGIVGFASTQTLQPLTAVFTDPQGRAGYWDLVTRELLPADRR